MNKDILRMQMLSGVITESEYKAKLEELGGGMSPKRVFKRAVVAKLNKIYNSVDNEELKQKLMDTINPTIDSIVNGKYGDDIGKYPMADLLDDLDDYLKSITQSIINQSSPKDSLNENFVGMGMVGNIFDREKTDYELAFEHFTKGTSLNEVEVEEEGAKWVQKLLNPHDYITLKAGTLLTIKRPPGFIKIPKETEAVYFGVNKFNQVEVAVRNDLGWNTGTVESGDIKELSSEEARAFMDSLNLEEASPLEGGPGYMTKNHAGVLARLISDLESEDTSNFSESNLKNYEEALSNLKTALEATKAKYKEETGKDL